MSLRYPGGLITKSPTAPTTSAAKGVWTLEQALQYIKAGTWPLSIPGDPYFQYNSILLPGQGTNGAQNNTFLDSSTNNFTITRNGNTTQGTFTPFVQANGYWSIYNPGLTTNSVNFTTSAGTLFQFPGDFTIEMWVFPVSFGNGDSLWVVSDNTNYLALNINTTDYAIYLNSSSPSSISHGLQLNKWSHVAMVRSGSTITLYTNGVSRGTLSNGSTLGFSSPAINRFGGGAPTTTVTYASNIRIVKGVAVYTGTFTPPTSPLAATQSSGTNISAITGTQTSLLTGQSNRYLDNSTNALVATIGGSPSITGFSPFGAPTTAYSASTVGGSGYFDGSGDTLLTQSTTAFNLSTNPFCIEMWFYWTGSGSSYYGLCGSASDYKIALCIYQQKIMYGVSSTGSSWDILKADVASPGLGSTTIYPNTWYHLVLCRTGNTFSGFVNGVRDITTTSSAAVVSRTEGYGVGSWFGAYYYALGYISNFRFVVGSNPYDATQTTLTVPTAPLTSITNTQLLLSGTNAGIIDNAEKNDLETVGNAQISTSQYKWGTSSMYFDGTGDYLLAPSTSLPLTFGTGDFTIEAWIYPTSVTSTAQSIISNRTDAGADTVLTCAFSTTNGLYLHTNSTVILNSGVAPTANTWQHVVFGRTGGTLKIFLNGNQVGSAAMTQNLSSTSSVYVGKDGTKATSPTNEYSGYIADLRVTKGYARYPYNFTAPTAAFPLFYQAAATPSSDPYFENVTMLLPGNGTNGAQNNTFLDSSTNAFTITRNGNTTQGTFTPFSKDVGAWGNYFDGSTSYLTTPSNSAFAFGTGDFTVEAWVYLTGTNYSEVFTTANGSFPTTAMRFMVTNAQKLQFYDGTNTAVSGASIPVNAWTHVAVSRSGTSVKLFINGIQDGSTTSSNNLSNTTGYIGRTWDGVIFAGYISNLRITKGGAIYTSTFTPSTTPLTTTVSSGTVSLLTCQSNRFIDNSVNAFALTVSGSPSVQSFSPFSNTAAYSTSVVSGSGYFDGSGDWLTAPSNAAFALGSVFTIEFWIYPITYGANAIFVRMGESSGDLQFGLNSGNLGLAASGVAWRLTGSAGPALNTWSHCVLVRSGTGSNQTSIFLNGTRIANGTVSDAWTTTVQAVIQATQGDTYLTKGYMSDIRVVKGTAVYDPTQSTLTVPTAPLTAISGTSLLLSGTNGGIIDNAMSNDLETVGNAQISTTQSKFGGSSMYFDGSGDYLFVPNTNLSFNFGTGDFTVEGWIYLSATPSTNGTIIDTRSSDALAEYDISISSSNKLDFIYSSSRVTSATSISNTTWTHFAITRSSGTIRLFINGTLDANTASYSGTVNASATPAIGGGRAGGTSAITGYYFNGYMNDLRITKGIARYTGNFTPPTTAFLTL